MPTPILDRDELIGAISERLEKELVASEGRGNTKAASALAKIRLVRNDFPHRGQS